VGEVIGQYELKEVLGGGGMATVYRGVHVSGIGMTAAIKKLHPHLAVDSNLRKRLRVEAQALVRLDHPNVVRILDFVEEEDSCALVVELVEGRTLRAVMDDYDERPMPLALALLLFRQILVAVGHAHQHNCLHRDIKPGNVMVSDDNLVKVLDFGIASLVDQERLTQTGMSIGTPVYMAPEAILNGMEALDERADVYALGVTFWELLAGKGARPIGQRGWRLEPEMVDDLLDKGVPETVIEVVKSMTELDVEQRLGSCDAILHALNWAMEESAQKGTDSVAGARAPLPASPGSVDEPVHRAGEAIPRTLPFAGAPIGFRELPTKAVPGPAAPASEPARGEAKGRKRKRAAKKTGAGKRKPPSSKPPRGRRKALIGAAVVVLIGAGGALWAALGTPGIGPVRGDPAALAVLKAIPQCVAFDRGAFFYGPEDRRVVLSAFALERTEVTLESYAECVAAGACPNRITEYLGYEPTGASPMQHVDWMQATTYCEWRYRNTTLPDGYEARLPTDAEWERAARGTSRPGRAFPLGSTLPADLASAGAPRAPNVGTTSADVTPEGVLDMTASVSEWVFDAGPKGVSEGKVPANFSPRGKRDPVSRPEARARGTRAVRGGDYTHHPSIEKYFRSTSRVWTTGTRSGAGRGFRCAAGPMIGGSS
jgi:tRNA A-37 threonylcarbamoyl transferase component Bud32